MMQKPRKIPGFFVFNGPSMPVLAAHASVDALRSATASKTVSSE
jgi:hypothetical protein